MSRRCGGGFAKQVAGNVEKRKSATLLGERLEIRLDENLDGLFAGINLDTYGRVAKSRPRGVVRSLRESSRDALRDIASRATESSCCTDQLG